MTKWIEVNIYVNSNDDREFLIDLYESLIKNVKGNGYIDTWHFFREPYIRLRFEAKNDKYKSIVKSLLESYLNNSKKCGAINNYYYGCHGEPNKEYNGEEDFYGKEGFNVHKQIWYWQSELAILRYKQEKEGRVEMSREWDVDRLWHLVANQLHPLDVGESVFVLKENTEGSLIINLPKYKKKKEVRVSILVRDK